MIATAPLKKSPFKSQADCPREPPECLVTNLFFQIKWHATLENG